MGRSTAETFLAHDWIVLALDLVPTRSTVLWSADPDRGRRPRPGRGGPALAEHLPVVARSTRSNMVSIPLNAETDRRAVPSHDVNVLGVIGVMAAAVPIGADRHRQLRLG
jgi:hypothetical protein